MARADLDKKPHEVAAMFDDVAPKYDRMNTILSAGQDRRWRRHMVRALHLRPGMRVADIAAGTAVSTADLIATGAWAVAVDFSPGMLQAAGPQRASVPKVAADGMALPFADDSFDAVTISFGLRNIADTGQALAEFARITKPGGQLLVCEFSRPRQPVRTGYYLGLRTVLPLLATVSANPEAYSYLGESIRDWPDQPRLAALIADSGWSEVTWRNLSFGVVALHHAIKPAEQARAIQLR